MLILLVKVCCGQRGCERVLYGSASAGCGFPPVCCSGRKIVPGMMYGVHGFLQSPVERDAAFLAGRDGFVGVTGACLFRAVGLI